MGKIYTRSGDKGETSLIGGKRVLKSSLRVDAYGNIDELNSILGLCIASIDDYEVKEILKSIQNELFIVGADLAEPELSSNVPRVRHDMVKRLEEIIDRYEGEVGQINYFILPGGSREASLLHIARAVARRAERSIVALSEHEQINKDIIPYMNRLSSLLFVLARLVNKRLGTSDVAWKGSIQ
jgi:cob(I)alamin adenosyltransferase